jgi:hypothetical protein
MARRTPRASWRQPSFGKVSLPSTRAYQMVSPAGRRVPPSRRRVRSRLKSRVTWAALGAPFTSTT